MLQNSQNAREAGFTDDQMAVMAKEQLQIEMDTIITIQSIEHFPEPSETVLFYVSNFYNYF